MEKQKLTLFSFARRLTSSLQNRLTLVFTIIMLSAISWTPSSLGSVWFQVQSHPHFTPDLSCCLHLVDADAELQIGEATHQAHSLSAVWDNLLLMTLIAQRPFTPPL